MGNEKNPPDTDFDALAAEALDLWQEHLASYATDPKAKNELMRMMEPARQWFADWAAMMQHGAYGANLFGKGAPAGGAGGGTAGAHRGARQQGGDRTGGAAGAARAASAGTAPGHGTFGVAQLARHVAELEKRVAELEKRLAGGESRHGKSGHAS
ncbi:MAG TPA: hypothetical protein VMV79_03955 [Alphaproteobacteria bacterium]|nr:hypothetical protein [Alphaproteobacteria bacterium]